MLNEKNVQILCCSLVASISLFSFFGTVTVEWAACDLSQPIQSTLNSGLSLRKFALVYTEGILLSQEEQVLE